MRQKSAAREKALPAVRGANRIEKPRLRQNEKAESPIVVEV
jgi:hypothetical protein